MKQLITFQIKHILLYIVLNNLDNILWTFISYYPLIRMFS